MTSYYFEHQKIYLSVDCIIFGFEANKLKVLIGKRQMDPGRGEWSLYGGFVRNDEGIDEAAKRTLYELTGIRNVFMSQVSAFGNVDRDPGERVVSIAYYALINVADYSAKQQKDHGVEWVNIDEIPEMFSDHKEMVQKARKLLQRKIKHEPVGFQLRNFRKRVKEMDFIEKTDLIDKLTSKRGAVLYRFNKKMYEADLNFKL